MSRRPSWLNPLTSQAASSLCLRDRRTSRVLATGIETAFDSATRRRGLLGRDALPTGHAIVLAPCNAIHTFFMRFAIDVVFVRRSGEIVRVCRSLRPWRLAIAPRAIAVVEMRAGSIGPDEARAGDVVELVPLPARPEPDV